METSEKIISVGTVYANGSSNVLVIPKKASAATGIKPGARVLIKTDQHRLICELLEDPSIEDGKEAIATN